MTKEECFYLGRITKPFGVKGQMVIYLDVDDPARYANLDGVLVEVKDNLIPYFIQDQTFNSNKVIVTFEELTADEAQALAGHDIYLPLSMLPKLEGNQFYFHEVTGWEVIDEDKGPIGTIKTILDNPAQPLFQIMQGNVEILIPVVDPIIKKVARDEQKLYISAPPGLIDLYTEGR